MKRDEIRTAVLEALLEIAPDVDASALDPAHAFRDQFDFDSMDTLHFAVGLKRELGVDIPETDYARLSTLDRCVEYLAARVPAGRNARGA